MNVYSCFVCFVFCLFVCVLVCFPMLVLLGLLLLSSVLFECFRLSVCLVFACFVCLSFCLRFVCACVIRLFPCFLLV